MEPPPGEVGVDHVSRGLHGLLRQRFGFRDLRPHQRGVVEAMLRDRDVLAVLPTGSGKSLCYQLPAVASSGSTLVISPLVSLMDDQVTKLRRRGISAAALHASLPPGRVRAVRRAVRTGELRLLYVSPERLLAARFLELVAGARVRRVVVDEAHCVSEWGHDFRPAYRRIASFVRRAGALSTAAFTATATPATRKDIRRSLRLRDPYVVTVPADRPNLGWEATEPLDLAAACSLASRRVRRTAGASVVYVPTRRRAVRVAAELRRRGSRAAPYHAGLAAADRREIQRRFLAGELPTVSATSAFGMGIDHPRVRLVCHVGIPASLEAYVQQAGRAGRDGRPARCLLVPTHGDRGLRRTLLASSWPKRRSLRQVWKSLEPGRELSRGRVARRLRGRVPGPEIGGSLRVLRLYGALRVRTDRTGGTVRVQRRPEASWTQVDLAATAAGRRRAEGRLQAVWAYAETRRCRREVIARYFEEEVPSCSGCDRCGTLPEGGGRNAAAHRPRSGSGPRGGAGTAG